MQHFDVLLSLALPPTYSVNVCVCVGIINCDPLCGFRVGFDLIFACQFIYLAQVELVTAKLC